ncbi:META domain-containing protein [Octadecabacter sp.]|nr:META domain-containing protein [Octadecabacter sp.]
MRMFILLAFFAVNACGPDETISGYADTSAVYHLVSLDGVAFPATATISFPEQGAVSGQGPCNRYSASQNTFYPWFELGPILSTRRACAELDAEAAFFAALSDMSLAEVAGDVLLLTGENGRELTFEAR